jgi:hypothetical protein
MQGSFPLKASGLAQGGVFRVNGAQAEFSGVQGQLTINAFRGSVLVRELAPEAVLDANSDSAPIRLVLPQGAKPALAAATFYGAISGTFPLTMAVQGKKQVARAQDPGTLQTINLSATFADIAIDQAGNEGPPKGGPGPGAKPASDTRTLSEAWPPGTPIFIDATVGDVHVRGTDGDKVEVSAELVVWVDSASKAPAALDALSVQLQKLGDRINIATAAPQEQMDAPGSFRITLNIAVPRAAPLEIQGLRGLLAMSDLAGPIKATQTFGRVTAENTQGPLTLINRGGNVEVKGATGAIDANVRNGDLVIERSAGESHRTVPARADLP